MKENSKVYDKITVGRRIRTQRVSQGLSRKQVAEQIGKTEKYYADIERGYCGMSLETMLEIAGMFGRSLDYLVFGESGSQDYPAELRSILFSLKKCEGRQREKALDLLRVYLAE